MNQADYTEHVAPVLKQLWPLAKHNPALDVQRAHWFMYETIEDVLEAFSRWHDNHKNSGKPDWDAVIRILIGDNPDEPKPDAWTKCDELELCERMRVARERDNKGILDPDKVNARLKRGLSPERYERCKAGPDFRVNNLCESWVARNLMDKAPSHTERVAASGETKVKK